MHSKRAENEEQGSYRHPNPIFQDFPGIDKTKFLSFPLY